MNIIKRELIANLKSLLLWSAAVVAVLLLASVEFRALDEALNLDELMASLPQALQSMLSLETIRFDQAEGYYGYIGQFMMLVAALFGGLSGANMLSKEIRKKTIETALPLPITRRHFLAMKTVAAILNCVVYCAITYAGTVAAFGPAAKDTAFLSRALAFVGLLLLVQVLFLFIGLTVSVLATNHKRTGSLVATVTVAVFFVALISRVNSEMEFLTYLTPFEYFPSTDVMYGNALGAFGFIAVPVLIAVLGIVSFVKVKTKDIYT